MRLDVHSIMTSLRIIVEINAVSFRQRRSSSVRGTTGMCTPLWVITSNWRIKWGLSLFTKPSPLVPSSTTWHRGYHPLLMTTPQHELARSAKSPPFRGGGSQTYQQQCKEKLHFGPYADIPSDGLY